MPEGTDILPVVLYSVFAILVILSNSIVIIVITKSRQLHLATLWNIAHMAAWDLALGLHFLVFIVPSKIVNAFVYPDEYGQVASILLTFIMIQNVLNIVVALVDRYISICRPLHYTRLMTPKRFTLAVASVLLINILRVGILQIQKSDGVYNEVLGIFTSTNTYMKFFVTFGIQTTSSIIIIALLIKIRLELRKANANTGSQQPSSTQFTYTLYVSTIVYIVSYIPGTIAFFIGWIAQNNDVLWHVGSACVLSNSLWNVFIYAATYRPFRDAFLKLFCPTVFKERARRDFLVHFNKNKITVLPVVNGN